MNPWTQAAAPEWTGERRVFRLLTGRDATARANISRAAKARACRTSRGAGGKFGGWKAWTPLTREAKMLSASQVAACWPLLSPQGRS